LISVVSSPTGNSCRYKSINNFSSEIFFFRSMSDAIKPKRVLTEAQRLAFLKGREKRMANIEKRRLEKEEQKQVEAEPIPELPIPVLKRQVAEDVKPAPASSPAPAPAPAPDVDDKIVTAIEKLIQKMQPPAKPVRKPYTRKPKEESSEPTPASPPPSVRTFTWM
jgi:hypothetical protein